MLLWLFMYFGFGADQLELAFRDLQQRSPINTKNTILQIILHEFNRFLTINCTNHSLHGV